LPDKDNKSKSLIKLREKEFWWKSAALIAAILFTVSVHYGWVLEPIFGHRDWCHAIHSRLCYIPIVVAAAWFGLRGGLMAAGTITILILPFLFSDNPHLEPTTEIVEIVFYFATGILVGLLVDRESRIRKRQQTTLLELERSHRLSLVGQMAAGVAHEIKNPLASIQGAVEIITSPQSSSEDRREFQDIVTKEINRIDGTIKGFLQFARQKDFEAKRFNLSSLTAAGVKQVEPQAALKGVAAKVEIEENIFIEADAEKIQQVLLNLLLNAIDASHKGSLVLVSLSSTDESEVELSVSDQGEGISRDEISKIFDPFYSTKPSGTGLGLAIVKSIIDNHGATINVTSELGRGTKFTIIFPRESSS
jgi:signal transduction histidine kinase